jgi:tetratricopeptide (TPR) repeat protein
MLLLAALTFVLYSGTLSFDFVWDDHATIVENPMMHSLRMIPRAFASQLWFIHDAAVHQAYYRPLPVALGVLLFPLMGLKPWTYHLFAVLYSCVMSGAVFALARRLRFEYWTAALAALIFAVHPVHVECAAWIGASGEAELAVFFFLAFIAFLHTRDSARKGKALWRIASYLCLAAALLTKETAVVFCALVFVYEWLFSGEERRLLRLAKAVKTALPYAAITIVYLLVRQAALHRFAGFMQPQGSWKTLLLTEPLVLIRYVRLLLWPTELNALYYTPYVQRLGWATVGATAIVLALVALLWFWWRRSRDPRIVFAALWIPLTLAPVLYLPAFAAGDFVRDRYLYIPSAGFALLLATVIRKLPALGRWSASRLQAGVAILIVLPLATACALQQSYWANDIVLFYRGQQLNPQSVYAATSLGQALERHGYYERAAGILEDVVRKHPDAGMAHYVLASAYAHLNRPEDARHELAQGITVFPAYAVDQAGMNDVAAIYGALGDYERALQIYHQLLRKQPDYYLALYNAGYTCFRMNRLDEAERLLRHATQVAPDLSPPCYYLGRVLLAEQRSEEAVHYLRRATEINPNGPEFHYWLGQVLEQQRDLSAARQQYEQELRLDPSNQNARARLAALEK